MRRLRQGQAMTEYVLLLAVFVSVMLVIGQVMTAGFARSYEAYTGVMQCPPPLPICI